MSKTSFQTDYHESLAITIKTFFEIHNYNTRNASLRIRKIRNNNEFGAKSMKIKGSDLWNNLNNSIKESLNTKQFRSNYKKAILPYNRNA